MKITIAGGTGFVGYYLANHFLEHGHAVTILSRARGKVEKIFGNKVSVLDWNSLRQLGAKTIKDQDVIINLCGAGIAEQKWTNERKHELINSRIKPTQRLAEACAKLGNQSPALFNASAIGIYGINDAETIFDETSEIKRNAKDFAQELVLRWEDALKPAETAGVRVLKMRFGVVMGKNGGALSHLLPFFKLGLGGKLADGKQPFPWISIVDLAKAIDFCIEHNEIQGVINFVAPQIVTQAEFAKALGNALQRPTFLPTPAFIIRAKFGEMGNSLLLHGQRVAPTVLTQRGFQFTHPNLVTCLQNVV